PGKLEIRQPNRSKVAEHPLVDGGPLSNHDGGSDILAQAGIRYREGHRVGHGRMLHQNFVDLARRNLCAATIDDLLRAAPDEDIAFRIDQPQISGSEPAIAKAFRIGLWAVRVAGRDTLAANDALPDPIRPQIGL